MKRIGRSVVIALGLCAVCLVVLTFVRGGWAGVALLPTVVMDAPNQRDWSADSDGGIFLAAAFCNTPYDGDRGGMPLSPPVVGIAQS